MSHYGFLILGGTQMLGRDFTQSLVDIGQTSLVIANRGLTNPELFRHINHLAIDRDHADKCKILKEYTFDTIIDFSCYSLNQYLNTANQLNKYQQYILVSTQSVYDYKYMDSFHLDPDYARYCINKQRIEHFILTKGDKDRTIIIRPCAVYGDHDYTGRFEKRDNVFYWKNTNTVACPESGAISVKTVTELLLKIISEPNHNSKSYNLGL
jgi:nucleoside-diphosphate-sugar epimerase